MKYQRTVHDTETWVQCADCGESVKLEEAYRDGNVWYCAECAECAGVVECTWCHEWVEKDNAVIKGIAVYHYGCLREAIERGMED